jgi:hypothetical protein
MQVWLPCLALSCLFDLIYRPLDTISVHDMTSAVPLAGLLTEDVAVLTTTRLRLLDAGC